MLGKIKIRIIESMTTLKYSFKTKPYNHQMAALGAMLNHFKRGEREFALLMEMGCGKTKVLIDGSSFLYDNGFIGGILVICPNGVKGTWVNEIETHMPEHVDRNVVVWTGQKTKKHEEELSTLFVSEKVYFNILIMNVDAFTTERGRKFADRFLMTRQSLMVVDESTVIKNPSAIRTKAIIKLGFLSRYRVIMTGSPVTKSPEDLYSQCNFLNHELLGFSSIYTFRARHCQMQKLSFGGRSFNKVTGYKNLDELNYKLQKFSYRVLKKDALDLPGQVWMKRIVAMTTEQLDAYMQMKRTALVQLKNETLTTTSVLAQLIRLHQIVCGHMATDDGRVIGLPNNRIKELLAILEEHGDKAIIWATYRHDIQEIEKTLQKKYGTRSVVTYYGDTPQKIRQENIKRFQEEEETKFFIGQPMTGGRGITLTAAHLSIFYSNNYDLEIREQAEARNHRIGTAQKVTYIDLLSEGTVDEKIIYSLRNKINLAASVLAEDLRKWLI
jgi:SNF2 family DNA or RNA helicase|tara:strand:- start:36 stop:1529 length:1494 start_codon:yes stop_codon:yes gene_type:complete